MHIRYQRLLYVVFILLFFIITPIVFLQTSGYRYNFKKNQLEKTGILVIQTEPNQAIISLNNQPAGVTPLRLTRLLPGEYEVEITKPGFHSWHKRVSVQSNLTSFITDVILLPDALPTLHIQEPIELFNASLNNERLLFTTATSTQEQIHLLPTRTATFSTITTLDKSTYNSLHFVSWSPDNSLALLKQTIGEFNHYLIINVETGEIKELFDISKLNFTAMGWDQRNNDIVYGLSRSLLSRIDLITNTSQTVLAADIHDFRAVGADLYYIAKQANDTFLYHKIINAPLGEADQKIKLPNSSGYIFGPSPNELLALINQDNQDFFLIEVAAFESQDIIDHTIVQDKAKHIVWKADNRQVIIATDFELSVFDLDNREKRIITRYGDKIDKVLWHPLTNHIIYQLGNQIKIIEAIAEEKNDIVVASLNKINGLAVDPNGKQLIINGSAGERAGIYLLPLK